MKHMSCHIFVRLQDINRTGVMTDTYHTSMTSITLRQPPFDPLVTNRCGNINGWKYFCFFHPMLMTGPLQPQISHLFVAGINYRKSDLHMRGRFALTTDAYGELMGDARRTGFRELFALSTCNRTELYALSHDPSEAINLLCRHTDGDAAEFEEHGYIKIGHEAAEHLMQVTAGLDSQILGDYDIVSQVRHAVIAARSKGLMGGLLDRLVNHALQASKQIKNRTSLRDGTVSVSFAAVQYIKEHIPAAGAKKILLAGTGKIGKATARHLVGYLGTSSVTLVNRTDSKATELAAELDLRAAPHHQLRTAFRDAQVILMATSDDKPVLHAADLRDSGAKWIIDLSVPSAVSDDVRGLPGVTVVTVDEISRMKDESLRRRQEDVPAALDILHEQLAEFREWLDMRQNLPVILAVREKLLVLRDSSRRGHGDEHPNSRDEERIQKVINGMALRMRSQHQPGCHFIEALHQYITPGSIAIS
jgi:glutamyl-tRNA reductase